MNLKLFIMAILSFLAMYFLMYAMVDRFGNVYANLNQFYMAGLMTAAMILIEIGIMKSMYGKRVKILVGCLGIVALVIFFAFIRGQTGISDKDFLKSMISHHGSALLMCEKADIKDPEVKRLCEEIITSQKLQIDWMKTKLIRLK